MCSGEDYALAEQGRQSAAAPGVDRMPRIARPHAAFVRRLALALGALLLLAGCGGDDNKFPPLCPAVAFLGDAADLVRYNGAGRDVTDITVTARMTAVPGSCLRSGANSVQINVVVNADVARGPAFAGRAADVPYFVAVTDNGRILDKQEFVARVEFPSNQTRVKFSGPEIKLYVSTTAEKSAAAYKIFVGFSLTPEELATNRRGR